MSRPRFVVRLRINAVSADKKRRIGPHRRRSLAHRRLASPLKAFIGVREHSVMDCTCRAMAPVAELRPVFWLAREVGPAAHLSGKRICFRYFCSSPISRTPVSIGYRSTDRIYYKPGRTTVRFLIIEYLRHDVVHNLSLHQICTLDVSKVKIKDNSC